MARQNKKRKSSQGPRRPRMTSDKIAEIKTWLERMQVNAARAIKLSDRMSPDDMEECNDLFWALAKYTENVEESVIKLDDINKGIYPSLVELEQEIWKGLKGMRSRLAHAFWNIDPQILWSTVTKDFPDLMSLLSSIIVIDKPVGDYEEIDFTFETQRLLGLPDVASGSAVQAGHSILALCFGHNGRVGVFRVAHQGTNRLLMHSNFDSKISVYGRRKR